MEKLWILLLVMGVFLLGITGCEWGSEVQSGENAQTPQVDEPATLLPEQTPQASAQQAEGEGIYPELIPEE